MAESEDVLDMHQLAMFILDVLQHDVAEQVGSIVKLLNNRGCIGWRAFWPRDFTQNDVLTALRWLVDHGLVIVYMENPAKCELLQSTAPPIDLGSPSLWFGRSEKGKHLWDAWEPPTEDRGK